MPEAPRARPCHGIASERANRPRRTRSRPRAARRAREEPGRHVGEVVRAEVDAADADQHGEDGRSRRRDDPDPRTEDHPEDERDREVEDEAVHGVAAGKAVVQRRLRPRQLGSGPLEDQLHGRVEQDAAEDRDRQEQRLSAAPDPEQDQLQHDEERRDHRRGPDGGDGPHDPVERRRRPAVEHRGHDRVERDRLLAMDLLGDPPERQQAREQGHEADADEDRRPTRPRDRGQVRRGAVRHEGASRLDRRRVMDADRSHPILSTVSRPAARHGTRPELEAWRVACRDREATRCRSLSTASQFGRDRGRAPAADGRTPPGARDGRARGRTRSGWARCRGRGRSSRGGRSARQRASSPRSLRACCRR